MQTDGVVHRRGLLLGSLTHVFFFFLSFFLDTLKKISLQNNTNIQRKKEERIFVFVFQRITIIGKAQKRKKVGDEMAHYYSELENPRYATHVSAFFS